MEANHVPYSRRIASIDFLRGLVMILMALDHVRMYFGPGTWYAVPTDLAATTPLLFFTRWVTHFCAPVFVFLAGTAACLYGDKKASPAETASFLLKRGIWLILAELTLVGFAWTFDITFSFVILQVIWATGVSMVLLAGLVFVPEWLILTFGVLLVFGHNLLDPLTARGTSTPEVLWYLLHQPHSFLSGSTGLITIVYPVFPWVGLMALGYVCGRLYRTGFPAEQRRRWLLIGGAAVLLFVVLRGLNLYGEPQPWQLQDSPLYSLMSFLNTTKYPPSLHFLLMTMGPALLLLSLIDGRAEHLPTPVTTFGRVPFFFYLLHLYLIHALAMAALVLRGGAAEYILTAERVLSGSLRDAGLSLGAVYGIWPVVILLMYPLCEGYDRFRAAHPSWRWLRYL